MVSFTEITLPYPKAFKHRGHHREMMYYSVHVRMFWQQVPVTLYMIFHDSCISDKPPKRVHTLRTALTNAVTLAVCKYTKFGSRYRSQHRVYRRHYSVTYRLGYILNSDRGYFAVRSMTIYRVTAEKYRGCYGYQSREYLSVTPLRILLTHTNFLVRRQGNGLN